MGYSVPNSILRINSKAHRTFINSPSGGPAFETLIFLPRDCFEDVPYTFTPFFAEFPLTLTEGGRGQKSICHGRVAILIKMHKFLFSNAFTKIYYNNNKLRRQKAQGNY